MLSCCRPFWSANHHWMDHSPFACPCSSGTSSPSFIFRVVYSHNLHVSRHCTVCGPPPSSRSSSNIRTLCISVLQGLFVARGPSARFVGRFATLHVIVIRPAKDAHQYAPTRAYQNLCLRLLRVSFVWLCSRPYLVATLHMIGSVNRRCCNLQGPALSLFPLFNLVGWSQVQPSYHTCSFVRLCLLFSSGGRPLPVYFSASLPYQRPLPCCTFIAAIMWFQILMPIPATLQLSLGPTYHALQPPKIWTYFVPAGGVRNVAHCCDAVQTSSLRRFRRNGISATPRRRCSPVEVLPCSRYVLVSATSCCLSYRVSSRAAARSQVASMQD